jgi:hypothetical protein
MPDEAFAVCREQVYADAAANAKSYGLKARELKPIPTRTASGHESVEWVGGPNAWFGRQFERPARRAILPTPEECTKMMATAAMQRVSEVIRHRPTPQPLRTGF